MNSITCFAFAKINLGLRVLARRPDGYHDIETRLQTIDLADEIVMTRAASLTLEVAGSHAVPADQSNLVMRAARALAERYPGHGARMALKKSIPPGAGLGGGSSDAAVTLLGLDRLWGLDADPGLLYALARRLGSDVPFFLYGGTCLAVERGDEVLPLPDAPEWHVVLVWTGAGLSTREVYEGLDVALTRNRIPSSMSGFVQPPPASERRDPTAHETLIPDVANDLEERAFQMLPVLRPLKERLARSGAAATALTGSGSALFGLYSDAVSAGRAAATFSESGTVAIVCRTLTREEYCRRMFAGTRN